jgi:hypothetical protein
MSASSVLLLLSAAALQLARADDCRFNGCKPHLETRPK